MFSKLLVLQFNIHSQEISLGDAIACRNGVQCCLNDSVFRLCSTTSNIILGGVFGLNLLLLKLKTEN